MKVVTVTTLRVVWIEIALISLGKYSVWPGHHLAGGVD